MNARHISSASIPVLTVSAMLVGAAALAADPVPSSTASAPAAAGLGQLKLDLTPEEKLQLLSQLNNEQISDDETSIEALEVRASAANPPEIPAGLFSLAWAIVHPANAWRIFMPIS